MANLVACLIVNALLLQCLIQHLSQNASYALIQFVGLLGVFYGIIALAMAIGLLAARIRARWVLWLIVICFVMALAVWNLRLFQSMSGAV